MVKSDFVDAKRILVSSFPSLHNTPRSLELRASIAAVNVPAKIRGECIDTVGFWIFSFFGFFFGRGVGPCGLVPPLLQSEFPLRL